MKKTAKKEKTVLVTGAFGGMGRATVAHFSELGWRVFALDLAGECDAENVIAVHADVTDEESLARAADEVRAKTVRLDAIVHFAGIYMLDSLLEIKTESFDKIMDINLRGAFLVNKLFAPLLSSGSRILITTSELAPLDPLPFTGVYAVSKAALDKYAYSLAMEMQLLGISVSVLRAGAVSTDMLGVSTTALDRFCENTKLYTCNAARFKSIVEGVEAKNVPPQRIAVKCEKILLSRRVRFAYSINRNPLLLILNALPKRLQLWVIRKILKK